MGRFIEKPGIQEEPMGVSEDPMQALAFTRIGTDTWQRGWDLSRKYLLQIRDLVAKNHINFVIVIFPRGHQVDGTQWGEKARREHGFEPGKVYSARAFPIMEKFGKENSIPVINLLETFRRAKDRPFYYVYDGHFNKTGNRIAVQGIYDHLKRRRLIPE